MSHDPTDLEGQEEQKKENAEEARVRRLQEVSDFRWLMRQRPFRRFMWKLLGDAGVFRSVFSKDVAVMTFLEGQRNVGLQLLGEIETHSPQEFDLMRAEVRQSKEMKADGR